MRYWVLSSLLCILTIVNTLIGVALLRREATPTYSMGFTKTAPTATQSFWRVEYVSNTDGDTLTVNLPDVLPDIFGKKIPVRIRHIDTAEMRGDGKCEKEMAAKAKAFTQSILSTAKKIDLEDVGRDKYFRLLAQVVADGVIVSDALLAQHLAVPYEGETKAEVDWCKMMRKR